MIAVTFSPKRLAAKPITYYIVGTSDNTEAIEAAKGKLKGHRFEEYYLKGLIVAAWHELIEV